MLLPKNVVIVTSAAPYTCCTCHKCCRHAPEHSAYYLCISAWPCSIRSLYLCVCTREHCGHVLRQCMRAMGAGGHISSIRIIAAAAIKCGANDDGWLDKLAQLGGRHPHNQERQWHRMIKSLFGETVAPYNIKSQLLGPRLHGTDLPEDQTHEMTCKKLRCPGMASNSPDSQVQTDMETHKESKERCILLETLHKMQANTKRQTRTKRG